MKKNIIVHLNRTCEFKGKTYKCAIGRDGITKDKKEGDWKTPVAYLPIREIFFRPDKLDGINTVFKTTALTKDDGWADDPADLENYNKHIKLPYESSHEKLWREDDVYDIVVVLGWNDKPAILGKGSAIFMHVARPEYTGTAGCIALKKEDLLEILEKAETNTEVCILEE